MILVGHMETLPASPAGTPFHVILLWGDQSIDSGADNLFLDATLASKLNILTQPLSIPMHIGALDGRSIGRVTHNTTPIHLRVSGNHSEAIQFLLIKSPLIPVVLGFSWLQRHSPLLNWSTGSIMGWSPFCHAHCLKSAQPAPGCFPGGSEGGPDLSSIPADYQDLWTTRTSRGQPYDCKIDLLPSTVLSVGTGDQRYGYLHWGLDSCWIYLSLFLTRWLQASSS
jgi:hypothetical protein